MRPTQSRYSLGSIGLGLAWLFIGVSCTEEADRGAVTHAPRGGASAGEGAAPAEGGGGEGAAVAAGHGGEGAAPAGGGAGAAPTDPFASCSVPTHPCGRAGETCDCTPELLCQHLSSSRALECGRPGSYFDGAGCLRQLCASDEDCATGSRCVPSGLVDEGCLPSALEACDDCMCGAFADCGGSITCIEEELAPPERDCDLTGSSCPESARQAALMGALEVENLSDTLRAKVEACLADVVAAREICAPEP